MLSRLDVGAQFLGERVMTRHLVVLAAFLVQPPAGAVGAEILRTFGLFASLAASAAVWWAVRLLDELNRDGITIIMTTHDLNAVAVHLPEVLCFNHGLIARGPPASVFTDAVLAATFGEDLKAVHHAGRLLVAHVTPLRG